MKVNWNDWVQSMICDDDTSITIYIDKTSKSQFMMETVDEAISTLQSHKRKIKAFRSKSISARDVCLRNR